MPPPQRQPTELWRLPAAARPWVECRPPTALRRCSAVGIGVLLGLNAGQLRAEEFFAIRDQNPLLRGFYLPLPSDSRRDAGPEFSATLLVSNTLNVDSNSHERLLVDGESDVLDLTYENALSQNWRYRFTLPLYHDSGGVLDTAIDTWHQAFGFRRGDRPYYPKNRIEYFYSGRGKIDLDHPQSSVGDLAADLGWYAIDDASRTVSFWGGLKAPTGSVGGLTSDGAWDGALWAHAAMRWPKWRLAAELGIAQPFGDEVFGGHAHRSSGFANFVATRDVGTVWSLRAQLDGQSGRVAGSDMRFLGPSLQLAVGAARRLRGRWRVEMGFAEDIAVNTAPDITFFLGIHG